MGIVGPKGTNLWTAIVDLYILYQIAEVDLSIFHNIPQIPCTVHEKKIDEMKIFRHLILPCFFVMVLKI